MSLAPSLKLTNLGNNFFYNFLVTVNNNSPIQDYVHPVDQTQPTFEISFTVNCFLPYLRLTVKIFKFLRLYTKFLALLRLSVNPIETLRKTVNT